MNEFIQGFLGVFNQVFGEMSTISWYDIGHTVGTISIIVGTVAFFFLACIYAPYRYDKYKRKRREMDPNNPYYGRDTLESR